MTSYLQVTSIIYKYKVKYEDLTCNYEVVCNCEVICKYEVNCDYEVTCKKFICHHPENWISYHITIPIIYHKFYSNGGWGSWNWFHKSSRCMIGGICENVIQGLTLTDIDFVLSFNDSCGSGSSLTSSLTGIANTWDSTFYQGSLGKSSGLASWQHSLNSPLLSKFPLLTVQRAKTMIGMVDTHYMHYLIY